MLEELRVRAKELYEEKDYFEALKLYETIKKSDETYLEKLCLFHYMWCLYRVKLSDHDAFDIEKFPETKEIVKYILSHQTNEDILYQLTVFKVLKHYKAKQNFEAAKINEWLDKLDPSLLSEEAYRITVDGKEILQQSKKEEWYSIKSKVYEKLEMYHECLAISEEALRTFKQLHNSNHTWFKRRMAISKWKLEDAEEAIKILLQLLQYKKEWYIYYDLSRIHSSLYDYDKSLNFALDAILRPGEDNKKVRLYWDTAKTLEKLGSPYKDFIKVYVILLKQDNHWKLSNEENAYYQSHKEAIDNGDKDQMKRNMIKVVKELKWKDREIMKGVISKILPNNKSGFITGDKGSYYFQFNNIRGKKESILKDKKVTFYLEENDIDQNGRARNQAVNITMIED